MVWLPAGQRLGCSGRLRPILSDVSRSQAVGAAVASGVQHTADRAPMTAWVPSDGVQALHTELSNATLTADNPLGMTPKNAPLVLNAVFNSG